MIWFLTGAYITGGGGADGAGGEEEEEGREGTGTASPGCSPRLLKAVI